MKNKDIYLQGR